MEHTLEFRGRLLRSDDRPVAAGKVDLRFDLRPTRTSSSSLWNELIRDVEVQPGGFFAVVLGRVSKLDSELFRTSPRFVSVRTVKGARIGRENAARVPVSGTVLRTAGRLDLLERRLEEAGGILERDERIDKLPGRVSRLTRLVEELQERLEVFETTSTADVLLRRIETLRSELDRLCGEDGRLRSLEDELQDIVGPDGDVVDLSERMDRLEGKAPELIEQLRAREAAAAEPVDVDELDERLQGLVGRVGGLEEAMVKAREAKPPKATVGEADLDRLGAVKRSGDTMTGGLVINRGGLEVMSGGITSRGAEVSTLEASNLVKAPKVIADAIELRGEFTVDNPHRAIQCRLVEGRQGSARRDGHLYLNTRGGGEVVVGNADESRGLEVHGSVRSSASVLAGATIALVLEASGDPVPGDVMRLVTETRRAGRVSSDADSLVLGVCVEDAGLLLGGPLSSGKVAVATQGIVQAQVDASAHPVVPGALLVASARLGHARPLGEGEVLPQGALLGKALEGLEEGQGTVLVLLSVG